MKSPMMELPLTNAPINRQAGMVMARGEHWDWHAPGHHFRSDTPPATRPIPAVCRHNLPDLVGRTIGRLTVVGLARDVNSRWVVRCSCGAYEMRTTRAIRNERNADDRCSECRQVYFLREGKSCNGEVKLRIAE